MMDWDEVRRGMAAARSCSDVADQATMEEIKSAGGPDFLAEYGWERPAAWHFGYDHAILLARAQTG